MRKFLVLMLMLTLAGSLAIPGRVTAQTPPAGAGQPVPIFSIDGNEIGAITINNVLDPFEDYDQTYSSPLRGYHFVALDVTFANSSQRAFTVDPYALKIVDSDGYISDQASISLPESPATPLLEYTDALAPGTDMSGIVTFEMYSGSALARILYSPSSEIQTTIADVRTEQTSAGTPVSIIGTTGTEIAQVTVNAVSDPFDAYDEFSAPPRGSRFVAIDVSVVNTGTRTLSTTPSSFVATDDLGFRLEAPFITSTDPGMVNFDYLDLASGEEQRGILYFQVLEGIPVVQLTYGDGYTMNVVVADLALGAPPITVQPTAVPVASSPDCEGLVEWGLDLIARNISANALTATFDGLEPVDMDPVALRDVSAQFAVFAQETRDSNPPVAAQELNSFFAEQYYQILSDATSQLADAIEADDPVAIESAVALGEGVLDSLGDGGEGLALLDALELECPNEIDELNTL